MRRRAVIERFQQVTELAVGLFIRQPDGFKYLFLDIPLEDSDTAATDLGAVQNHIIRLGLDPARVALQILKILVPRRSEGVMHRHKPFLFFIIFKHREIEHPGERKFIGIDQVHPPPHFQPQLSHGVDRHIRLVGDDQHQIAFFGLRGPADFFQLLLAEKFRNLGFQAFRRIANPSHPLGPVLADIIHQTIEFPARNSRIAFHIDPFDAAAGSQHRLKHLEIGTAHCVRQIKYLHAETQIRFIRTIFVHGFVVGESLHRQRHVHVQGCLENFRNHGFHDGQDILPLDKGHLDVELSELRLAIRPQIFVPEATDDLKIALNPGHHENLLENLRGLRQRIKLAGVDPAGDKIVPRTFRRAFRQHRRFHLDEIPSVKEITHRFRHPVPQHQVALHLRPPEIQITIFEANDLIHVDVILNIKRWGFGRIQNTDFLPANLHGAGFHQGVHRILGTQPDFAPNTDDIFSPNSVRFCQSRRIDLRRKDQLHNTGAVPQVNKNQSAMIPLP